MQQGDQESHGALLSIPKEGHAWNETRTRIQADLRSSRGGGGGLLGWLSQIILPGAVMSQEA